MGTQNLLALRSKAKIIYESEAKKSFIRASTHRDTHTHTRQKKHTHNL